MDDIIRNMSTHDTSGKMHERQRHDGYLPIAVAIMLGCALIVIFIIKPEAGGYGGGNNPSAFFESAGVMSAGVLIGYLAFVFRAT